MIEGQRPGRSHCQRFPYARCRDFKTGTGTLADAESRGDQRGRREPVPVLKLPVAHQVELTLERLDLRSAMMNLVGHHDLALRFASGQAMGTNGLSGRKSSADVQTMDIIRLMGSQPIRNGLRNMVDFAREWPAFGSTTHTDVYITAPESTLGQWIPACAGMTPPNHGVTRHNTCQHPFTSEGLRRLGILRHRSGANRGPENGM
jgi:hypothetical protein